jgi:hypothetical protein
MRRTWIPGLFAFTILLGLASYPSAAQESNPPGSYQQTCSDVSVKKGTLYAKCQDEKGKKHSTKLSDYEKCGPGIANNNGKLTCTGSAAGPAASFRPIGSYTQTCRDIHMKGSTLHAICKGYNGHESPTFLQDADRCSQGVINTNGTLSCDISEVLPPGSYIATCKDLRLQGTTLLASCNNGSGRWVKAELHDVNVCNGDISNQGGALHCAPVKKMERR